MVKFSIGMFMLGLFLLGIMAGRMLQEFSLTECKEDEVWYPADFDSPTNVGDLTCIHIDQIIKGSAK